MKILVALKAVPDNTRLRFENGVPVLAGAERMVNPYDEYALETALRLKDATPGATVVAVGVGEGSSPEHLKKAIAAGADEAVRLEDPALVGTDSLAVAAVLAAYARHLGEDVKLICVGQQALDTAAGVVGPALAAHLDWPVVARCQSAEWAVETALKATREAAHGLETVEVQLPAVLTTVKCVYELRTANIKGVMRANKAEIPVLSLDALGITAAQVNGHGPSTPQLSARPPKAPGILIQGDSPEAVVPQLVQALQERLSPLGVW